MSRPGTTKPQGAKPGVSDSALPGRLRKYKRKRLLWQFAPAPPPLQSLAVELATFNAIVHRPGRETYYMRHRTLKALRWMGAERVARAALLAGKPPADIARMIADVAAIETTPPFHFNLKCAQWVVEGEFKRIANEQGTCERCP